METKFTRQITKADVQGEIDILNARQGAYLTLENRGSLDAIIMGEKTLCMGTGGALLVALGHIGRGIQIGKQISNQESWREVFEVSRISI